MDSSIVTNPGDVVLVKVGKEQKDGFYIKIIDVTADQAKKNWWAVKFYPLVLTPNFQLPSVMWLLDDEHIRGGAFTINNVPYQLFSLTFLTEDVKETLEPMTDTCEYKSKETIVAEFKKNGLTLVQGGLAKKRAEEIKKLFNGLE
jgi:hypothetical protein